MTRTYQQTRVDRHRVVQARPLRRFCHTQVMLGATFADLRYRYRQFIIAVVGAGVVLGMALLLSGMAAGFRVEIDRTVGAVGADRWVMSATAQGRFTAVSLFPEADAAIVAQTPGVSAAAPL